MIAILGILLLVVAMIYFVRRARGKRVQEIAAQEDTVLIDTPQPPPGLNAAETACFVVRSHPLCPADANVVATTVRGGAAIQLTVDGTRETFIDRSYAAAALEVENWLSTRVETVPVVKANRHERRAAKAAERRGRPN